MDSNKAVITTKNIASKQSEVLSVYHDLDDDWQFMGVDDVTEDDAMVLSINEIIEIDSTVKDVLDIDLGYSAHRKSKKDKWTIQKDE